MQVKVKKSYTYKEVCKIKDKAMELGIRIGIRETKKYIREHNKFMLAYNKAWSERQSFRQEE
tara:strand:+ start:693 stop:878 length:186 start_codon:yes stop_codon:yes gene_type:complete